MPTDTTPAVLRQTFKPLYRGSRSRVRITLSGLAGDWSGAEWVLAITPDTPGVTDPHLCYTSADGEVTLSFPYVDTIIPPADSELLIDGDYLLGLWRVDTGSEQPVAGGSIEVKTLPGVPEC